MILQGKKFGGLTSLCASGISKSVNVLLVVAGHTKFAPDLVSQNVAGCYNMHDTLNHAHLQAHVEPHGTSIGYDRQLLLET